MFQFTPAHDGRLENAAKVEAFYSFNSRPRTTGDRRRVINTLLDLFQFTPAHDGRLQPGPRCRLVLRFNSRPRTTGDP